MKGMYDLVVDYIIQVIMDKAKVSVIIPTYKRSNVLPRAINSVLNQTYKNIEVIVVDDNNPRTKYRKDTEMIMEKYRNDKRVRYIKHDRNKNGSAARNTGIANAHGEYIAFLDDDDEYLPRKIEVSVKRLEPLDENWAGCYTAYKKILKNNRFQYSLQKKEGSLLLETLARNSFLAGGSNLLIRKSTILDIGGFDESFIRNQDIEFLVRIFRKYKIAYVDECSLIIHYEVRDMSRTYEENVEIEERFIQTFKSYIEELSEEEKNYVYTNIALQRFRISIYKRKIIDGIKNLRKNNVAVSTIIHYIFYIIHRILSKTSYGFNLKLNTDS